MAGHASVKLLVLWEHELRAVAEVVARLVELQKEDKPNQEAMVEAYSDLGKAAYIAFGASAAASEDTAWVLCNHSALKFEPRITEVAKRPMENGGPQ